MKSFAPFAFISLLILLPSVLAAEVLGHRTRSSPHYLKNRVAAPARLQSRRVGLAGANVPKPPSIVNKQAHRQRVALPDRGRGASKKDLNSRLPARSVSLPLHRVAELVDRSHIHPVMYFQQQLNQAHRRYARHIGHAISDQELVERLKKRAESVNLDFGVYSLQKRGKPLRLEDRQGQNAQKDKRDNSNQNGGSSGNGGFTQQEVDALLQNKITDADAPTAQNSLGLDIESNDVGYFANVQLGTPGKQFAILMDTGSANFWVPSEECENSDTGVPSCKHQTLGLKSSSSFLETDQPFSVKYGTGNVQGNLVTDNLNIASLQLNNLTFGVTRTESDDFANKDVPFDGLMGLARSSLSQPPGVLTPIEAFAQAGVVQSAQMGFALGRVADGTNVGQITFGGVDRTKFKGDLTIFNNVNPDGFWEGDLTDVAVNGSSLQLGARTAILDTGTTLIVAPNADAAAVHAAIPGSSSDGQGGFTVPCTTQAIVSLTLGGKSFDINPSDLAVEPTSNDLQGDCFSGISGGDILGPQQWLVGDVFLKNVYLATDVDNNQIGLGVSVGGQGTVNK